MSEGNGADGGQLVTLTRKDFQTHDEVRWCPGCGDYTILQAVQTFLPELGVNREDIVFVSGIGCAARFPYYMNVYGMHSIHGRAPAIATGIALARPELSTWVVTGDGDALSIGGNHLIHALRRNVNLKILMFNNMIYGLTKGQYSPTSELGKVTKSTPFGSLDHPFNPISLALGAEATFVARTVDNDRTHTQEVLRAAAGHRGSAFIEIYQNCNVFNDKAFEAVTGRQTRDANQIRLEHGQPIRFGTDHEMGIATDGQGRAYIARVDEIGIDNVVVHDAHSPDPSLAFALSRLAESPTGPTPIGVFRNIDRSNYGDEMLRQMDAAANRLGEGDLKALLRSGGTWDVA